MFFFWKLKPEIKPGLGGVEIPDFGVSLRHYTGQEWFNGIRENITFEISQVISLLIYK